MSTREEVRSTVEGLRLRVATIVAGLNYVSYAAGEYAGYPDRERRLREIDNRLAYIGRLLNSESNDPKWKESIP